MEKTATLQNIVEQSTPKQDMADQSSPKQNMADQSDPKQNMVDQSDPKQNISEQIAPKFIGADCSNIHRSAQCFSTSLDIYLVFGLSFSCLMWDSHVFELHQMFSVSWNEDIFKLITFKGFLSHIHHPLQHTDHIVHTFS